MSSNVTLRKLGKDGPMVPPMGFGLMGLCGIYGSPPPDEERMQLLDHAHAQGNTFWDTADIYGDNEEMLGKWFKRTGKRDDIFLSSKVGIMMDGMSFKGVNNSPEYIKQQCNASLKKLGTDHIDLYYIHRIDSEIPIEKTMRVLAELKAEGKIKYVGLSESSSTCLKRAMKIMPIAAVQMEYNPFTLDIEGPTGTHLLRTCRELGVAVVCFSPLGRGMVTSSFANKEVMGDEMDARTKMFPRFQEENANANAKLVSQFKGLAEKKGCSTSQLALAWLLKQGDMVFPNPGTKKIKYLDENWAALNVKLSDADEKEVRDFVENVEVSGYRSVFQAKSLSYADTVEED